MNRQDKGYLSNPYTAPVTRNLKRIQQQNTTNACDVRVCLMSPRQQTLAGNTHECIRYYLKLHWAMYLRMRAI
jgi:hypothetical protein